MAGSEEMEDDSLGQQSNQMPSFPQTDSQSTISPNPVSERVVNRQTHGICFQFFLELLGLDRSHRTADDLPSPSELIGSSTDEDDDVFEDNSIIINDENTNTVSATNRTDNTDGLMSEQSDNTLLLEHSSRGLIRSNSSPMLSGSVTQSHAISRRSRVRFSDTVSYHIGLGDREPSQEQDQAPKPTSLRLRRATMSESDSTQRPGILRQNLDQDQRHTSLSNRDVGEGGDDADRQTEGARGRAIEESRRGLALEDPRGRGLEEQVGKRLALIGDEVNDRYSSEFERMVRVLKLNPDTAYDGFAVVARHIFRDGVISWGRIVVLMCFGYRLILSMSERGVMGMFSELLSFLVQFIIEEKLSTWIASQGGWGAALRFVPENVGWRTIGAVCALAFVSVAAVITLSRR